MIGNNARSQSRKENKTYHGDTEARRKSDGRFFAAVIGCKVPGQTSRSSLSVIRALSR